VPPKRPVITISIRRVWLMVAGRAQAAELTRDLRLAAEREGVGEATAEKFRDRGGR
jgi:hypothetical protein